MGGVGLVRVAPGEVVGPVSVAQEEIFGLVLVVLEEVVESVLEDPGWGDEASRYRRSSCELKPKTDSGDVDSLLISEPCPRPAPSQTSASTPQPFQT